MGAAKIQISSNMIARWFEHGFQAAVPVTPLRDLQILDAKYVYYDAKVGTLELLVASPDLPEANYSGDLLPFDAKFRSLKDALLGEEDQLPSRGRPYGQTEEEGF